MKLIDRIFTTIISLLCIIGGILQICKINESDLSGFGFVIAITFSCIDILIGIAGCILSWVMNRK